MPGMLEKVSPLCRFPGIKFSFMSLFMSPGTDCATAWRSSVRAASQPNVTILSGSAGSFWLSCSAATPLRFSCTYLKSNFTVRPAGSYDGTKKRLAPAVFAHEDWRLDIHDSARKASMLRGISKSFNRPSCARRRVPINTKFFKLFVISLSRKN